MAKKKAQKVSIKANRVKGIPPHVDRLYKAVANYVKMVGGSVVVIGGVQIQQWPGDGEFRFTVGIRCSGRKPDFPPSDIQEGK